MQVLFDANKKMPSVEDNSTDKSKKSQLTDTSENSIKTDTAAVSNTAAVASSTPPEPTLLTSTSTDTAPSAPTPLSKNFLNYLNSYHRQSEYLAQTVSPSFEVDELALGIGKFYEKIRKVIDWKEENALRRGAIYRGLKRHLVGEIYSFVGNDNQLDLRAMTETLVVELLHSGYFDNDRIDDAKISQVQEILQRVLRLLGASKSVSSRRGDLKNQMKFRTWLLEICTCDIEALLAPSYHDDALIELMKTVLKQQTKIIPDNFFSERDLAVQLEIAVGRSLYNADDAWLTYEIIRQQYPQWLKSEQFATSEAYQLTLEIYQQTKKDLRNKAGVKLLALANKYDAAYRLIDNLIRECDPQQNLSAAAIEKIISDQKATQEKISTIYTQRRKTLKARLWRSGVWATLSLLVANVFIMFILEVPIASLYGAGFSLSAIVIDIINSAIMMFILITLTPLPKKNNYPVVENEILKIIYQNKGNDVYHLRLVPSRASRILSRVFSVISFIFGLVCTSGIIWFLFTVGLPWTSVIINLIDVLTVFFAASNIRYAAQEITIRDHGGLISLLADAIALPLARAGRFFANKWKEYNVVAIFFSAVVDIPFSALVTFVEDWRTFLKEKHSELSQ